MGPLRLWKRAEQYRTLVQQRLTEIRGSLPVLEAPPDPALGVRPMSEEEIKLNNQWPQVTFSSWTHDWIECYTDGSFIPNSQSAGGELRCVRRGNAFPFGEQYSWILLLLISVELLERATTQES